MPWVLEYNDIKTKEKGNIIPFPGQAIIEVLLNVKDKF